MLDAEGRFEGAWRGAVYWGAGSETFAKGSTYRGEYSGGLRNGWGICRFHSGDYYEVNLITSNTVRIRGGDS